MPVDAFWWLNRLHLCGMELVRSFDPVRRLA